jgi:cysteine desulfurase
MQRIYLDHAATTPVDPRVRAAMEPFFTTVVGNPSSVHWHGRQAKAPLEQARATIATALGAHVSEIFFTSGGTEGDNLAILGSVQGQAGLHLVTAAAEHHAVLDTCRHLESTGHQVTIVPVDASGRVELAGLESALKNGARFVSIMHGNNEVGTIQPVRAAADLALRYDAVIHTDAVQSVGKIPVHVDDLGVHMLTLSAHKIGGPKGSGVLYVRRGTRIAPMVHGGGQERGLRPGTENVALAAGCAEAVRLAVAEREEKMGRLRMMRDALEAEIVSQFPYAIVNGDPGGRLPQLLSVSFDASRYPMEGEMLVTNMDLEGISVSSGSACTSGSVQPSHVLLAMGRDEATAKATLRFSFGSMNSADDVNVVFDALKRVIGRMTLPR